jgi:uncharacterized protein YndB with AHSA1/START domain
MPNIRHRIGIAAPSATVYESLSTPNGLAGWWTRDVRGESSPGGELDFHFETASVGMQVEELVPGRRVAWRCVRGPEEWVGTEISFELGDDGDGETVLLFEHADWSEPVEFMYHCSTKWASFLIGLKRGLEGGAATPFPDDQRIGNWR